tara:strand:+ start:1060 stop:2016 length:957 start_codon:yes stop_codon:yes gene_type:complete
MATYVNNLRLKEITTGDEDGTWGTSTNTNLELIGESLGFATQAAFSSDADATTTVADGATDPARALYFKVTSGTSLSTTRTLTIGPNTVSRVMWIENATSGSQSINISQGSGANVTIPTGAAKIVYLDGAGSGAAVVDALGQVDVGDGTVTSVGGTGTVNGISLSGTVTSSGNLTLGGALSGVDLTSQVTGTLPTGNGGTGSTATTYCSLTANVSGVLPFANGGSGAIVPLLKSGNYTASNRDYIVVTAGSITITLPSSPSAGDVVVIKDGTGAAATTSFTVGRNSSNIASSASDLTFDKNFAEIVMTYINGTIGWSV